MLIVCGVLLLAVVAVRLGNIPIPQQPLAALRSALLPIGLNAQKPVASQRVIVDGTTVTLEFASVTPNNYIIDVAMTDATGRPIPAQQAYLYLTMPGMMMGASEIEIKPTGTGYYRAEGALFSMTGLWQVEASLQRGADLWVRAPVQVIISDNGTIQSVTPLAPTALPDSAPSVEVQN
jgi:hypothetical protein